MSRVGRGVALGALVGALLGPVVGLALHALFSSGSALAGYEIVGARGTGRGQFARRVLRWRRAPASGPQLALTA